jgi:hypothetical protein
MLNPVCSTSLKNSSIKLNNLEHEKKSIAAIAGAAFTTWPNKLLLISLSTARGPKKLACDSTATKLASRFEGAPVPHVAARGIAIKAIAISRAGAREIIGARLRT